MNQVKDQHKNDIAKVLGYHDLFESHKTEADALNYRFEDEIAHMRQN